MTLTHTRLSCRCGTVKLAVAGPSIGLTTCYCEDCKSGADIMQGLEGAPVLTDDRGGTPAALYQNDRVTVETGVDQLVQFRLAPSSPTRRIVAACCNTPMFLDYEAGFWLSLYRPFMEPEPTGRDRQGAALFLRLGLAFLKLGFRVPRRQTALAHLPPLDVSPR